MRFKAILFGVAAVAGLVAFGALAQQQGRDTGAQGLTFLGEPATAEAIAAGEKLYALNCASCHGVSLEGQPNWRRRLDNGRMPAPPHDRSGHTWHHSDRDLFAITRLGVGGVVAGYESDMPAFGDVLSDDEIAAVLIFIKSTWPKRQRDFQARVTANDRGGS
jgi:mono/diheme cytochrome c family protein